MTLDDRVRRTSAAAWQDLEGETVLLLPAEEKLLGLNAVAGRIWELADGTRTLGDVVRLLEQEFDTSEKDLARDTLAFVNALAARGLVEACRP
jgi:coenzyme PQQ biosynthesis protein PqqD